MLFGQYVLPYHSGLYLKNSNTFTLTPKSHPHQSRKKWLLRSVTADNSWLLSHVGGAWYSLGRHGFCTVSWLGGEVNTINMDPDNQSHVRFSSFPSFAHGVVDKINLLWAGRDLVHCCWCGV
jgi:hypothetical protein